MVADIPYLVYMLRCADDTLYTGITKDLEKRIREHNTSEKGAKYTRSRRPVFLVYQETCQTKSVALQREFAIKKMVKIEKEKLLTNFSSSESDKELNLLIPEQSKL